MSLAISEAMSVFNEAGYIDPMVKHLETQRQHFTADLGCDMGQDWFGPKGEAFRKNSLHYYVRMFLQATINRQFQMGATQVHSMIKQADDHSRMASLEPVQMDYKPKEEIEDTVQRVPAIYMEKMREQAKERRERGRKLGLRSERRSGRTESHGSGGQP